MTDFGLCNFVLWLVDGDPECGEPAVFVDGLKRRCDRHRHQLSAQPEKPAVSFKPGEVTQIEYSGGRIVGRTTGTLDDDFWTTAAMAIPPTHFAGVPIEEFCHADRQRILKMRPTDVGIAGLCGACTAKIDAATPALRGPEHPQPWKWDSTGTYLLDAAGRAVLEVDEEASPYVRALTAAAPEMDTMLRTLLDVANLSDKRIPGGLGDECRSLLARIDAAKG